jgi:predicted phosphodiesterase
MRVAALNDIHGNLPALEAVLHDIRQEQVDVIVVGGDIVPGPMPHEVLTYLLSLDIPVQFIHGNGELEALARMAGRETGSIPEQFREAVGWVAQQLQPDYEGLLANWPLTLQIEIPGLGEALFCHATPRDADEIFTPLTPEERLLPVFEGLDASLVVCGHTHMQFDRAVGHVRVVNAGSVGMPFSEPGAYWLLLGPTVEFRRTDYDLTKAAERIRQTPYPLADEFAERYVLHPPSEQEMLDLFTQHELKSG